MCRRPAAQHARALTSELVVFVNDRGRKRRSGRQKRAYGVPWVASGNLTGRPRRWQCGGCPHARALPGPRGCATLAAGGTVLGMVERVRAIMMTPQAEWPAVAARIRRCPRAPIHRHPGPDPGAGAAHRRLADRRLYAVPGRADRRRRRLCAELRDGLCGGAGGRSPGAEIRRASVAIPARCG